MARKGPTYGHMMTGISQRIEDRRSAQESPSARALDRGGESLVPFRILGMDERLETFGARAHFACEVQGLRELIQAMRRAGLTLL
jgi:hypothetical protein